jgi:hypothetical protein
VPLDLAELCRRQHRYLSAVCFMTDAFATDPNPGDDRAAGHRYAARSAALAAGQGEDAAKVDDLERARLRKQALDWLRAGLAFYTKLSASGPANARLFVQQKLMHWQKDGDLAGIRDKTALAKVPAEEQKAFAQLFMTLLPIARPIRMTQDWQFGQAQPV